MHLVSQVWVRGESVEVQMILYQHREIAKFGGRAMGVRTRMHIFSDSGGIQTHPALGGMELSRARVGMRWRGLCRSYKRYAHPLEKSLPVLP